MGFDWKSLVGTVAPTLATALGGPLAGRAVSSIAAALGLGSEAPEEKISDALSAATYEQMLALKQADNDFKTEMRRLDIDLERIRADDRDSARNREVRTNDSWTPRIIAAIVIGSALSLEGYVMLNGYPREIPGEIVGRILGTFDAGVVMILSYYFGSSSGRDSNK